MNILILGAYESNNLGDAILCECVEHMVEKHFPDSNITIRDLHSRDRHRQSGPPDFHAMHRHQMKYDLARFASARFGIDIVYRYECARLQSEKTYLEQICAPDYDLVIFAGGQMFMDSYALFLRYCVLHFHKRNIPILFHACGTGPSYSPTIKKLLAETLSMPNVKLISCRDDVNAVRKLQKKPPLTVLDTYDSALSCAQRYNVKKLTGASLIGLGIMYPNSLNPKKVMLFWKALICHLDKQNLNWKIFTNGSPTDDAYARAILSSIPKYSGEEDAHIASRDIEPQDLVHTISQFSGLISFRLHSHIVAASLDIPTVAIIWDHKLPLFFEKIQHRERCFTIKDSPEQILQGLKHSEETGYDRHLLNKQIKQSEDQLVQAIRNHSKKGDLL